MAAHIVTYDIINNGTCTQRKSPFCKKATAFLLDGLTCCTLCLAWLIEHGELRLVDNVADTAVPDTVEVVW